MQTERWSGVGGGRAVEREGGINLQDKVSLPGPPGRDEGEIGGRERVSERVSELLKAAQGV